MGVCGCECVGVGGSRGVVVGVWWSEGWGLI